MHQFLSFILVLWLGHIAVNAWILFWTIRTFAQSGFPKTALFIGLILAGIMLAFPFLYRSVTTSPLLIFFLKIGAFWLGIVLYVFLLMLLVYLLQLVRGWFNFVPINPLHSWLFVFATAILIGIIGLFNSSKITVKEFNLSANNLWYDQKNLTVAIVSDLHLGRLQSVKRLEQAVALINQHAPDAVFFVGDTIDDNIKLDVPAMREAVSAINAPLGVFGVLGNHEYYSGIDKSLNILKEIGITILRDEWRLLDNKFILLGRDDYAGRNRKNIDEILNSKSQEGQFLSVNDVLTEFCNNEQKLPLILLDHQPQDLSQAEQANVFVQFSAHTHNGQIWPANYATKAIYENSHGLTKRGDTNIIVSAGTGVWGTPNKNTARPEVLLVRMGL